MKIRPLMMDEDAQIAIKKVRNYAENNPYTISKLKLVGEGKEPPPGDNPNYRCLLKFGYICVFTLDQATKVDTEEVVWVRHLSVAVAESNKWPNEHAVNFLMKEFGFRQQLGPNSELVVWLENENDPTKPQAVNIVETYDEKI